MLILLFDRPAWAAATVIGHGRALSGSCNNPTSSVCREAGCGSAEEKATGGGPSTEKEGKKTKTKTGKKEKKNSMSRPPRPTCSDSGSALGADGLTHVAAQLGPSDALAFALACKAFRAVQKNVWPELETKPNDAPALASPPHLGQAARLPAPQAAERVLSRVVVEPRPYQQ